MAERADTPAARLAADMDRDGVSRRALARRLAGEDGKPDQELTNVKRWLNPERGISAASSARLAQIFARPADYYQSPAAARRGRLAEVAAQVEVNATTIAEMAEEIRLLKERVAALEQSRSGHAPARGAR